MTVYFSGYVFQDDGDALSGATVQLLQVSDGVEEDSTTSDSNGFWSFNEADEDQYDVKITKGSSVRYRKWADEMSIKMLDVRNNEGNTVPAAVFANHTNNADNDIVHYRGLRGTGADNDEMFFRYYMDDASSNTTEVARMTVKLISASAASEDSEIRWGVAVGGDIVDVFTISNTSGGATDMTMDVAGDINLDADGGDVFFKDGGTTFGSATNNSGNLIIKSGTTTALTFSGANLTAAGTIGSGAITSSGIVTGTGFTAGSAVLAEAELELLDGLTAGTAIASKVVTTDANIDTTGQRNLTISGELDAATLDISGAADIAGAFTLDGTGIAEYIADTVGAMTTSNTETGITVTYQDADNTIDFVVGTLNQDTTGTAAIATAVTITDNESTDEDNAVIFTSGGDVDGGNIGLESDGTLTYNPSTGKITATGFIGSLTGTADVATVATTVTITDNESTDEDNAVIFTAGGDVDGGNIGLESDGNLTYNPSTGRLTATQLAGTLQTAAQTNITSVGTIGTGTWQGDAIATTYIADNAITNAKMADDAIDSAEIANGAIDLVHMSSQSVDEDNLYISNSGSNGQFLSKQSGNNGGLTWASTADTNTTYTAGDGLTLTSTEFDLDAALTTVTSAYNPSLKLGRDSQNLIDFATTDNKIILRVNNVDEVELVADVLEPVTNDGVALGTTSLGWADLHLATGGVINWANGEMTITEGDANTLTVAGGTFATAALTATTGTFTGDVTVSDGSYNLNIASHDGTNGLALAGTVVTATAAQINVLTGATAGTSVASKAVVLDSNGDFEFQDSDVLAFGDGGDLQITHNSTESSIKDLGVGVLNIDSNGTGIHLRKSDGEAMATFLTDGAVTLYHNNLARIATSAAGVSVTGSIDTTLDQHFDSSPTDETVSGITATFTAGEALERGEVVYFKAGDSKMWKAVASAAGTMPVAAMAAADISADATGKFLLYGFLADNGTFPAYTVGGDLYAPEAETSSQNVPEQAAPDSDGDFVQVLGYAVTANSVFFNPDQTVVEVA
jgi:hypothetical protein